MCPLKRHIAVVSGNADLRFHMNELSDQLKSLFILYRTAQLWTYSIRDSLVTPCGELYIPASDVEFVLDAYTLSREAKCIAG